MLPATEHVSLSSEIAFTAASDSAASTERFVLPQEAGLGKAADGPPGERHREGRGLLCGPIC